MRIIFLKPRVKLLACLVGLFLALTPARADFLVNGDFSNGMSGWKPSDSKLVTVNAAHQVVIHESATAAAVTFSQDFTLPTGAKSLSFILVSTTLDTGIPPDAFNVALLDPKTQASLVPTFDKNTDAYYIRDLVQGAPTNNAAKGVTLTKMGGGAMLIDLDISAVGGQDGRLLFRLVGGGNNTNDTVTFSSVQVDGSSSGGVVPAPNSLLLVCSALLTLAAYGFKRRLAVRRAAL
jgi:hypothetical protein